MKNILLRIFDAFGWLWCLPEEQSSNPLVVRFLRHKIPIFWVMGPPKCGKTTVAEELAKVTDYNLLKCSQIIKNEIDKGGHEGMTIRCMIESSNVVSDEIIVNLLKREILRTFSESKLTPIGYIIDGFPIDLRQAKEFIDSFRKPSIIIFTCLLENDLLSRIPNADVDKTVLIENHNKTMKKLNEVYRTYERKTLKIVTNKSAREICYNLVEYLNAHYGYSL